ncbi:MAG: methylmalonyl-CoA mutase [Deltaproteobacteria bacterium GWA2_38_16]|nr:MAG: methylmalonyl-CoA mutase [Deltaproteobacteria bacterium GWA2_38_16]OGQ02207.1 MAG: methylmalonyl-CoA mutase [Deltaproteobacteria bacterium RIFCSPHIGHO2_02_FULL_38_15]OGQ61593.1 MAG: methylmalonyl-CoA mutase [Deltaproteobacteria bacterium RIFCSPLOWO2_12_FULL_38_8]HBQ21981.1 methylmalonyl-CoA mutase [Deltaproteobacteria bacterium]
MKRPLRLLVSKAGLDGHDRGIKIVARALRDAGMEVIYTGLHQTPQMIVSAALQEDVDAICVSILSGAHFALIKEIYGLLKKNKLSNIPIILGGIVPEDDFSKLKKLGVKKIFTPGASLQDIISFVQTNIKAQF